MHRNSALLFEKYAVPKFFSEACVLEIGPDVIPSLYQNSICRKYDGIVWETLELSSRIGIDATYLTDGYEFPISSCSYDFVVSGQVIEHVGMVWLWMKEVARVLKIGGRVVMICPVNYQEHRCPLDCWRILPDGFRVLYDYCELGTEIVAAEHLGISEAEVVYPEETLRVLLGMVDCIAIGRKEG